MFPLKLPSLKFSSPGSGAEVVGTSQSSVGGVTQRLRSLSNTSMAGQRWRRGYPPWHAQYLNIRGWFLLPAKIAFASIDKELVLPVAGLSKRHIAVCVILAESWNKGGKYVL